MSNLTIENKNFLVTSLIERGPPAKTMIRELIQNAIEAKNLSKKKVIKISSVLHQGTPKLVIWNNGKGLNANELRRAMEISSSVGKEQSLDGNFGIGAKVAALSANKDGVRYRSCKDKHVYETFLVYLENEKTYARFDYPDASITGTDFEDVADVTFEYEKNKSSLSEDWTEVTLNGNRSDQNTTKDPFDGNPPVPKNWVFKNLYERYFTLPADLEIWLSSDVHTKGKEGDRRFSPISEVFKKAADAYPGEVICEVVKRKNYNIHFFYTEASESAQHNRTWGFTSGYDSTGSGIIYKNEIYDAKFGQQWYASAPTFGVSFGSSKICIFLELNNFENIEPETYRENLRENSLEKK